MADEQVVPSPAPAKPGWKTTEFWLSLAATLVGAAYASGAVPTDGRLAKMCALAAMVLTAMGYTVVRTIAKK